MSDIEMQGRHRGETEVFDKPLGGIETNVPQEDFVVPTFRQETGNQRSDFPGTQNKYTMHSWPHFRSVYSRSRSPMKNFSFSAPPGKIFLDVSAFALAGKITARPH
jgi:hypothetical protein